MKKEKWAYWISLIGSFSLFTLGIFGLFFIYNQMIFDNRPYPLIDKMIWAALLLTMLGTMISLLSSSGRKGLK